MDGRGDHWGCKYWLILKKHRSILNYRASTYLVLSLKELWRTSLGWLEVEGKAFLTWIQYSDSLWSSEERLEVVHFRIFIHISCGRESQCRIWFNKTWATRYFRTIKKNSISIEITVAGRIVLFVFIFGYYGKPNNIHIWRKIWTRMVSCLGENFQLLELWVEAD